MKSSISFSSFGHIVYDDRGFYRLIGIVDDEEDFYYVLLTGEEELYLMSCVGKLRDLSEAVADYYEDYKPITDNWNLNGLTYDLGLELVKEQGLQLLSNQEIEEYKLIVVEKL